jgi:translation initiation factor IF-1
MSDAIIQTVGNVVECVSPMLYRVALPNGKELLAHLSKELATDMVVYELGQHLLLEMTPYDFETARITALYEA